MAIKVHTVISDTGLSANSTWTLMISGNNAHPPTKQILFPEEKNLKRSMKNHSKTQEGTSKDIPITNILEGWPSHNFKTQNCQT